jgi:hypothetical protein
MNFVGPNQTFAEAQSAHGCGALRRGCGHVGGALIVESGRGVGGVMSWRGCHPVVRPQCRVRGVCWRQPSTEVGGGRAMGGGVGGCGAPP